MTNQATPSRTCSSLPFQAIDHRALIKNAFFILTLETEFEKSSRNYLNILLFRYFVSTNLFSADRIEC